MRQRLSLVLMLISVVPLAGAQTVLNYELHKKHNFYQSSDSAPAESGLVKYQTVAYVNVADGQTIAQPSYTIPSGSMAGNRNLFQLGTTNDWTDSPSFTSKANLDSSMGNGDYDFSVDGNTIAMTINPESFFSASTITGGSWDSNKLQVNNTGSTTINFTDPTGGAFVNGTDFIRLVLRQQSVGTSFVFESSTLVNSFTIGAGNLVDGATYDMELRFFNVTDRDTTSIVGAVGLAGFSTETFAEVLVANSAVPEPSTYALFAGVAVLGLVMSRRRRVA